MMWFWAFVAAAFGGPDCVALDSSAPALEGAAGSRKVAFIVGVGEYKAKPGGKSMDLKGPPKDALRIREVLVERYGFPASNVCLLRDSEATRAQFIRGWREHLGRVSSGDTVVYYFAGHGSQTTDFDTGDETDGMDETILLHDSRHGEVPDLLDDELNTLIGEVYRKTENITILVDACNSGTATRGVDVVGGVEDDAVERRVEPIRRDRPAEGTLSGTTGDFKPERMSAWWCSPQHRMAPPPWSETARACSPTRCFARWRRGVTAPGSRSCRSFLGGSQRRRATRKRPSRAPSRGRSSVRKSWTEECPGRWSESRVTRSPFVGRPCLAGPKAPCFASTRTAPASTRRAFGSTA